MTQNGTLGEKSNNDLNLLVRYIMKDCYFAPIQFVVSTQWYSYRRQLATPSACYGMRIDTISLLGASTYFCSSVYLVSAGHSAPPTLHLIRCPSCKLSPPPLACIYIHKEPSRTFAGLVSRKRRGRRRRDFAPCCGQWHCPLQWGAGIWS